MKHIAYSDLKPGKGIPGSKVTIWRKENDGRFPKRTRFGPRLYGWAEPIIDAYNAALAAGRSEIEATEIAERIRARNSQAA
jgi:CP4-57 regulatory protein AlpA